MTISKDTKHEFMFDIIVALKEISANNILPLLNQDVVNLMDKVGDMIQDSWDQTQITPWWKGIPFQK